MKKYIYSFAALIAVFSLVSCGNKDGAKAQAAAGAQARVAPVKTVKVPTGDYTTFKSYPTSISGIINSEARPKISGYITEVLVDEGQKVEQGQLLFRLETNSLTMQAEAAKAQVNAAQVKVEQLKPLVEKNIISSNQLQTAKAQLKQAQSSYQSVLANIKYATVRSPIDGFVGSIRIRKGNLVSPSDPKPLTVISDISKVYAYFSMNEKDYLNFLTTAIGETRAEKIKNMPDVTLLLANGDVYGQKGVIDAVNSQIDPQTGTISFRAVFDNPKGLLTNGSTGVIKVPNVYDDVLVVPMKSTFERQGRTYVMKIKRTDSATVVATQPIEIKDRTNNLYLIESGLKKGEEIVAEGAASLRAGTPVKPMPQPFEKVTEPLPTVF